MVDLAQNIQTIPPLIEDATMDNEINFWSQGYFYIDSIAGIIENIRNKSTPTVKFPEVDIPKLERLIITQKSLFSNQDIIRFSEYLLKLSGDEIGLSDKHAKVIRTFWNFLNRKIGLLSVPIAIPDPEDDIGFSFIWNTKTINITIDIAENNTYEWFFKDRENGLVLGSEGETFPTFPEELSRYLFLYFRRNELSNF